MFSTSKNEFSLLGAFLMGLLWLLSTSAARAVELLDATLLCPAQKAAVMCFDQFCIGPLLFIVDAVTGTHCRSTIRPFATLSRLATSLSNTIIDWLHTAPSIPDKRPGSSYISCATQTSDDDNTSTMLEFFGDGLNHLAEFFDAGLKSVMSPFDGNTLKTSTPSLVALPSTPVRQQCSLAYQQKSTSPSILDCSDDDAA
ncbi:hypothetical protein QBC45DRAFT_481363 [Copromyces sp. CBS 386.78]|nr:hypothetical protein QBC45DRAFT_481363 [Copromyces sp. CBS 386.78]